MKNQRNKKNKKNKMRLIDANTIEQVFVEDGAYLGHGMYAGHYEYDIEGAPTVEAIPVEWLLAQSKKLPLTSEKGMYIDEILEDWQEENE